MLTTLLNQDICSCAIGLGHVLLVSKQTSSIQ